MPTKIKRLQSIGTRSTCVLIPKPFLDELQWIKGTPVTVTLRGRIIIIEEANEDEAA